MNEPMTTYVLMILACLPGTPDAACAPQNALMVEVYQDFPWTDRDVCLAYGKHMSETTPPPYGVDSIRCVPKDELWACVRQAGHKP